MPFLMKSQKCPVCGDRHDFYVEPEDLVNASRRYTFTCPKEDTDGITTFGDLGIVVRVRPSGSVLAHEVPERP